MTNKKQNISVCNVKIVTIFRCSYCGVYYCGLLVWSMIWNFNTGKNTIQLVQTEQVKECAVCNKWNRGIPV